MTVRSFHRAGARRRDRAARRATFLARRGWLLAGATLGATTLLVSNAQAATYTVTTTADSNDGSCTPALCSLRDAIAAANGNGTADTISFASGVTGTIDLGSVLDITTTNGLWINGPGASALTISGQGSSGVLKLVNSAPFFAPNANVITGLTLTDGMTSDPGGAVSSQTFEPLLLIHDVISNSTSTNTDSEGGGGGVFTQGPTEIVASTVSGNTAAHGGGVETNPKYNNGTTTPKYGLPMLIQNSTISGNHAVDTNGTAPSSVGGGGGVAAYGPQMSVRNSTVSGNTSVRSGGGISDVSKYGINLSGSKVTGNTAAYTGGGVTDHGWLIGRKYDPTVISTSTISGNSAHSGAGLSFSEYTFSGGGIHRPTSPGQPITIESSTVSGNHATDTTPHASNAHSVGGGIEVFGSLGSPFRLVNSTVSGNTADRGGGVSLGGGYYDPLVSTDPLTGETGSVSLENSTVADNSANLPYGGGGIYLGRYTTPSNHAEQSGRAALESTIVAGNEAAGKPNDLRRAQTATTGGFTGDFSLIQFPGAAPLTGNHLITYRNPQLGPLKNNGGATQTQLPSGKSPVIDQGHASLGEATDQRGDPRTVDSTIPNPPGGDGTDIGAVELSNGQVVPPPSPGFSAKVGRQPLGGRSTPVLVDGVTTVTCQVKIGTLGACALEVTIGKDLLAGGGAPAASPRNQTSTTVSSSSVMQRFLLKQYPLGIPATARAVGLASGPAAALGSVRLLGGPSITLPLGTGSTAFSSKVKAELDRAAKLLAGTRTVTLSSNSSTQANAVSRRLTADGMKGAIKIRLSRHARAHQITITFTY